MIVEYHRPSSLEGALSLLARDEPVTLPMGGGTTLNRPSTKPFAVVDLQALGLNTAEIKGNILDLGATLTLEALSQITQVQPALKRSILHEANHNLRQVATVAGTLMAGDGRSPITTAFLALDAQMTLLPGEATLGLGDLLPVRDERLGKSLITKISISLNVRLAYEYVARTPADLPIVCVAVASWPSGRTRVAVGGFGRAPCLAMDGPDSQGAEIAAREAYQAAEDEWASAEYRRHLAEVLTRRCLQALVEA